MLGALTFPLLQSNVGPGLAGAFLLIVLFFVVAVLAVLVLVAVWLYRDAKQRGENAGLWVTLFLVASFFATILAGIIVVVIWLMVRPKEIKYDRQGNLIVPSQPMPPPGWASSSPSPSYSSASGGPSMASTAPAASPAWGAPNVAKVKCPRCHTIFEYQKQPAGATHVKCPACGEEGNI